MKMELLKTNDGSHTLYVPELDECYHSRHGAIQETLHVFIEMGLFSVLEEKSDIRILEIGMGSGLNVLLTTVLLPNHSRVHYTAIEPNPLALELLNALNYADNLSKSIQAKNIFRNIHESIWEQDYMLSCNLILHKKNCKILNFQTEDKFDLVYFDAFAPGPQPEMWSSKIFNHLYSLMKTGAVLTTYCAKGEVRRTLQGAGFKIEKLKGPPGKREMLRAKK